MAGVYALIFWGAIGCTISGLFLTLLVTVSPGKGFKVIRFFIM